MPTASTLAPALGIFREKTYRRLRQQRQRSSKKKGKTAGKASVSPARPPENTKRANVRRHGNRAKSFTSKNILQKGLHFGKSVVQ